MHNCYIMLQMWARAYRDQTYHAAINTTNGVESQNKLLKYSYLPRRKNITLSQLATVLYDEFIPETHHKYLYLNYQMSDTYRTYNDIVPDYLRERPRQVIIHCLERKAAAESIQQMIFSQKMSKLENLRFRDQVKFTPLTLV